jgi:hypothetical protein
VTIYEEIAEERKRQDHKWGEQHHPDGTSLRFMALCDDAKARNDAADPFSITWQGILDEEVLEAFTETDRTKLRTELIQVAAVAVAWIEDLDSRADYRPPPEDGSQARVAWATRHSPEAG